MYDINGFFDLHVHIEPDIFKRRYNVKSLGKELTNCCSAAVIKSHLTSTIGIATEARRQGYHIYGSITLNSYVGGINKSVVQSAIAVAENNIPIMIYFPTLTGTSKKSKIVQEKSHKILNDEKVCAEKVSINGHLKGEVKDIIKLATKYDVPMATGHCSKDEVYLLIDEVEKNNGRLIITHPFIFYANFTIEEIIKILNKTNNVYVEITLLMLKMKYIDFNDIKYLIENVSIDKICISSDFGQVSNTTIKEGYNWFYNQMKSIKIDDKQIKIEKIIDKLCRINPMEFIGVNNK